MERTLQRQVRGLEGVNSSEAEGLQGLTGKIHPLSLYYSRDAMASLLPWLGFTIRSKP